MQSVNLYSHQMRVLEETKDLNRCAYYLDMGLGKTFIGAEKLIRLGAKINLVICQKSKISDWIEHFYDNYDAETYDLTKKNEFNLFFTEIVKVPKIGFINYELAWRRTELLKLKDFTLLLDESSLIQNHTAKQSRFVMKLKPKNVILLSGTPTSGKYENLWTQAKLLGWDITNKVYQAEFVNWTDLNLFDKTIKVVDKLNPYKNVERLKRKLREHGAVFMKTEDVLTLPEQNFIEVSVPKPKAYDPFMRHSLVIINEIELVGDTNLTKHLYSREICSIYSKEKQDAFRDLIQSTNDRIIVFYNFKEELFQLNRICSECDKPVSRIDGSFKNLGAYEESENSITLVQYQAGAMGLNLQKANKVIYYSLTERNELFEQSKKRIHRIGQGKPCFYYILMCKSTIEENIYSALKQKQDYTDELFRKECEHG